MKRVRVTVELTNRFIGLLQASCQMKGLLPRSDETEKQDLDPVGLLAALVLGEARGATELQLSLLVPPKWREDDLEPKLIHEERRVYDGDRLIGGGV
jgi:hypothetical protein